jgi:uncharacterized NAD(P)/FAD-binding protein YdhS
MRKVFRIAVIGGGASGALFILELIRMNVEEVEIVLFEPNERLGRGKAYEKNSEELILNTSAEKMSCKASDSLHFVNWIKENRSDLLDSLNYPYLPRSVFGDYLQDQLKIVRSFYIHIPAPVRSIKMANNKKIEVVYGEKKELFDFCCIATGYGFAKNSITKDQLVSVSNKFPEELNILGTGLSSIDTWMLLREIGYKGIIHFFSTSGEFPLAHKKTSGEILDFDFAVGKNPKELLQLFKFEWEKSGLQDLADGFRKSAKEIWKAWGESERRSFLVHLRARWQKIRHRVPPKIHNALSRELSLGRITLQKVSKRFPSRIRDREDFFHTTGFPIECSPFSFDPSLLEISKLGLGLESKFVNLEILGPPRIGIDWESSAIPEIRQKAVEISKNWVDKIRKASSINRAGRKLDQLFSETISM